MSWRRGSGPWSQGAQVAVRLFSQRWGRPGRGRSRLGLRPWPGCRRSGRNGHGAWHVAETALTMSGNSEPQQQHKLAAARLAAQATKPSRGCSMRCIHCRAVSKYSR